MLVGSSYFNYFIAQKQGMMTGQKLDFAALAEDIFSIQLLVSIVFVNW